MEIVIVILVFVTAVAVGYAIKLHMKVRRVFTDGQLVITEDKFGLRTFSLELSKDPDEISNMNFITFKVVDQATEDFE